MSNTRATATKWISIAVIVGSVMLLIRALPIDELQSGLRGWIEGLGFWGPMVFALIYIVATVCLIPGSIFTLAAGAIFGLGVGYLTAASGSVIGASFAFLIARYLARAKVESMAQSYPKFGAIDEAISEGGWKIVALLRLSPAIPFNLQNYLYGLTDIKFWPYLVTSFIAMMPGTFLYVYLGHVAGVAASSGGERPIGQWILLVVGLLATVVVTVYITRLAKQKLNAQTDAKGADDRSIVDRTADSEITDSEADESPGAAAASSTSSGSGYAIVAVVTLALAIVAQFQSDKISEGIMLLISGGPPEVTLEESYEAKPNGPTFDHQVFDQLLKAHVQPGGWVDYAALQANPAQLDEYIRQLEDAPFADLGRNEKLACLINAYNAFTLKLITEHYPIRSIRDIPAKERWEAVRWRVGGQTWSLAQIEHEQVRPHFVEPRAHFALVCAAIGCPPLTSEAYRGETIDEQLDRQARYVHAHNTWLQLPEDDGPVQLTPLYNWYANDFEQTGESILDYAARFSMELQERLRAGEERKVRFLRYDWTLNSIEHAQPR